MNENIPTENTIITNETLLALFRRTAHFMARAYHHQGHAHHAQKHVLAILREKSPINQRDLLDMLGIRSASLSELLAKLERGGLITREKDEQDKRNYTISISEEGSAMAAGHAAEQQESAEAIFAALDSAERQQLGELLIKVLVALEDAFPPHSGGHGHRGCEMRERCRHGHGHGHGRERGHGHEHGCDHEHGHGREQAHGRGPGHGFHGRHARPEDDRDPGLSRRGPHRRGRGPEEETPE